MRNNTFEKILSKLDKFNSEVNDAICLLSKAIDTDALSMLYSIYKELCENDEVHYHENQSVHAENIQFICGILNSIANSIDEINNDEFTMDLVFSDNDLSIDNRRILFLNTFHFDLWPNTSNSAYAKGVHYAEEVSYKEVYIALHYKIDELAETIQKTTTYIGDHPNSEKAQDLEDALSVINTEILNNFSDLIDNLAVLYKVLRVTDDPIDIQKPYGLGNTKRYIATIYNKDI